MPSQSHRNLQCAGILAASAVSILPFFAAAQDSDGIEPLTGLSWSKIYGVQTEVDGDILRYRIEFLEKQVQRAELLAAASRICARTDPASEPVVQFQRVREQILRKRRFMYVVCR
jgi:hypothetical protein